MTVDASGQEESLAQSQSHPLIYALIVNHYATLKELRDDYDIWEALELYEMCAVNLYNKYKMLRSMNNGK